MTQMSGEILKRIEDWEDLYELFQLLEKMYSHHAPSESEAVKEKILAVYEFYQSVLDPENQPSQYGTTLTTVKENTFEQAVRPAMRWLGETMHPHTKIILDNTCAELIEGDVVFTTSDYLRD